VAVMDVAIVDGLEPVVKLYQKINKKSSRPRISSVAPDLIPPGLRVCL
jgi:hypothetical protein